MQKPIDERYNLPQEFVKLVDGYVVNHTIITRKEELLKFWQSALKARQDHPEHQESIAEWVVSCAATSPLINDNDILDEIHGVFGYLESNTSESDSRWNKLKELMYQATLS